jgi:DNA polymerase
MDFSGMFAAPTAGYESLPWRAELLACTACTARAEARRVVPGVGPLSSEICIIGQNPGVDEDKDGVPFIGAGGDELNVWLRMLALDRNKLLVTNVLKCHTENNRPPRAQEIETCESKWFSRELASYPALKVIIPLGRPALFGIVGKMDRVPDVMEAWWVKADFEGGREVYVMPLAHPAYLLRTPTKRPEMYDRVLPAVKRYLQQEVPDVCARAAL